MKIFFDTSVLVASAVKAHEHHSRAVHAVERVANKKDQGIINVHTLAELYAVLTRLPISPAIQPGEAAKIVRENVVQYFRLQVLSARDYTNAVLEAAETGMVGGAIYDLLLLAAARKAKAARIYTFNVVEFRRLAPELHDLIAAP
jgi:predicted nucleic acid-binding protein